MTRPPSTPTCARSPPTCRSCAKPRAVARASRLAPAPQAKCRASWRPPRRRPRRSSGRPSRGARRCARRPTRTPSGHARRPCSAHRRTSRPCRTATAVLLERVASMDGEVGALVQSLRPAPGGWRATWRRSRPIWGSSTTRLAGGSGAGASVVAKRHRLERADRRSPLRLPSRASLRRHSRVARGLQCHPGSRTCRGRATARAADRRGTVIAVGAAAGACAEPPRLWLCPRLWQAMLAPASTDLDGARLVALNMALNGESREAGRSLPARELSTLRPREAP